MDLKAAEDIPPLCQRRSAAAAALIGAAIARKSTGKIS
jgi:hypothetical protein